MVRHKRIVETLDRGEAADWNDDHIPDYTDEIDHECNFLGVALTDEWDTAQTAGGSAPVVAYANNHAWINLNTGGVTGQTSSMRHEIGAAVGDITYIDDYPIHITPVRLQAFHTAGTVFEWGFQASAAAIFTPNIDGAYFRVKDNKLYGVTGDGAAETETEITGVTLSQDIYLHTKIELIATKCDFYVDDMETPKESNTTNLPDADLTIKYSAQSQNNVDTTMKTDACGFVRLRKH